jgi:hypothetical protein
MKTMDYASSAQSTKQTPTEEYDLMFRGGGTGPIFTWTFCSGCI